MLVTLLKGESCLYVCTVGINGSWVFSTMQDVCQRFCHTQTDEDSRLGDPIVRDNFPFFFKGRGTRLSPKYLLFRHVLC